MEVDCNAYALIAVNAPIMRMVYCVAFSFLCILIFSFDFEFWQWDKCWSVWARHYSSDQEGNRSFSQRLKSTQGNMVGIVSIHATAILKLKSGLGIWEESMAQLIEHGIMDRASDNEYMNDSPAWVRATLVLNLCDASCAPEQGTLL